MKVCLDFETRSRADLPSVGAHRYGCDPSTEVFMAAVSDLGDEHAPVYLWINPKFEDAGVVSDIEALPLVRAATEVHAHNAPFEQAICSGTGMLPEITLDKWRCTQAMARIAALPESLEKCGAALNILNQKDKLGKDLIKFFSIPQEDGTFNEPRDHRMKWAQFCEYCRQDVRAEREIHHYLKARFSLVGTNLDTFQFTLRLNDTGVPVNVPALQNAQRIITEVETEAGAEFLQLTKLNITQRAKILALLQAGGLVLADMQSDTLQTALAHQAVAPSIRRVLELYCQLSYAATKKITAMLNWVCPDDRLHGVFKFYGAGTGRWTAGGPQVQNAKKPSKEMRPIVADAFAYVAKGGTAEGLRAVYGEPIEVLSSCIRQFIQSSGNQLLDGDYNAIEARIACWVSGEALALDEYRRGVDRYQTMAAEIYAVPVSQVTKDQREVGKRAILGLGYGMGTEKFQSSCRDLYGINLSIEVAEDAKNAFRDSHMKMVSCWKALDRAMRYAVEGRSAFLAGDGGMIQVWKETTAGRPYLFVRLPSGRRLAYPNPLMQPDPKFGTQFTYWGAISGSTQWGRVKLYGAKLFENICQAIAADIMSNGARVAESRWMLPFALIHDQALAVSLPNQTPEDFANALASSPPWADGLPLKVEAHFAPYYSK